MTGRRPCSLLRRAVAAALCCVAASCSGGASHDDLQATAVLTYDRCQGLEPGLTRVDYAAVAGLRGSTLLSPIDSAHPAERGAPGDTEAGENLLLIAISRGEQPTPGYGLTLDRAQRGEHTAVIQVQWHVPESGASLPQVVTHPCLVVALPDSGVERVEARTEAGETIGTLELAGRR